ncbi:MAG: pentapeptide repeat-containing protein [Pseudomonadota bacterium]
MLQLAPRYRRFFRGLGFITLAIAFVAAAASAPIFAQQSDTSSSSTQNGRSDGVLSDDFARDTGAIIVTATRLGDSNLFEPVVQPADSCLANAPALGQPEPGFTINAAGLTKVRQLERIRRKTRAGTIFVSGGDFTGADFRRANLYDMCFFDTNLSQTVWSGSSKSGLGFINSDLTGADMQGSHLPSVLIRNTNLELVSAKSARWMQGRLDGGWKGSLANLDLSGADLTDFRIVCGSTSQDGCALKREGLLMRGADLRRASLHSFYTDTLDLADARIDQTELSLDHLRLLDQAKLVGPIVLRSARRAVMLFPTEVAQLSKAAQAQEESVTVCADDMPASEPVQSPTQTSQTPSALSLACDVPGSAMRALLQSVAQLEQGAQSTPDYTETRRTWIANRDTCLDLPDTETRVTCVTEAYRTRQIMLRKAMGKPQWLQDRGYRLFLSREAAFPTNSSAPGLYGRVLPVLLDQAAAAVIVKSDGKGGLAAKGVAIDGCYFEQDGLAYDVERALIGFAPERPKRRRRRAAPPLIAVSEPLLSIAGRAAVVEPQGLARAAGQCALESGFPRLEEIVLDDRLLSTIWERF